MDKKLKREIENLVHKTSFTFDEEENDYMLFSTRNNGDIMGCEYSEIDWQEGLKLKEDILSLSNIGDVSVILEPCDEWVMLTISF